MIKQVFTIYDTKAKVYFDPFMFFSIAEAIRAFSNSVNKPGTPINANPEDFSLIHIGAWDDNSAKLKPMQPYETLKTGLQCVKVHQMEQGYPQDKPDIDKEVDTHEISDESQVQRST